LQRLADCQREFALALLDADRATPSGLVGPDGVPSPRRFGVYRNNVVAGLIDALKDNYGAVCRIVGEEFFRAMAARFVIRNPPLSPIMLDYGAGFAGFIEGFEPAATLPYLADVARIERSWVESYHAADADPLSAQDLLAVDPKLLSRIRLSLHPSLRLTQSPYPAITIWRMNIGGGEPMAVDLDAGGEDALIVRADADVEVHQIPAGAAAFITSLARGKPVVSAAIAALEVTPHFDLKGLLAALVEAGALSGWSLDAADSVTGTRQ
jgi:hypothetical protein